MSCADHFITYFTFILVGGNGLLEYKPLNHVKFTEGILPEKCDFLGPLQLSWHKYSSREPALGREVLNCVL